MYFQDWDDTERSSAGVDWLPERSRHEVLSADDSNLIGSLTKNFDTVTGQVLHQPVLDIDFPAKLVPSQTEGHFHLYLDVDIPHEDYMRLLDALALAGIIEPGYAGASQARGQTFVATKPWKKR